MRISKTLWALILSFAALHLVISMALPLTLDEAYYQLWATNPSAGYYDHPPMVAWGIAAGQLVFGETRLGVRVFSVLALALVTLLTYRIAWLFSRDEQTSFRAALFGKAMMPFAALGFIATPDATSILFWTAAVWALAEVVNGSTRNWWFLVGLFAGLGVLAKFTNLFFGLSLVLWLIASKDGRAWLRVPQTWVGALIGIAVVLPLLNWNYQNEWIGFERQFGRLSEDEAFSLRQFSDFLISFVLLVTPLIFWLVLRAFRPSKAPAVLIWLCLPIIVYLTYHATKTLSGGQWLAPIFPTLAVIAALAQPKGWIARLAAPTGIALGLLILLLGFWPGRALIGGQNAFTQVRGWNGVSDDIRGLLQEHEATWIATDAYGLTGQLHHHFKDEVPVWSVIGFQRYLFRGPLPQEYCEAKGILIQPKDAVLQDRHFKNRVDLPDILRRQGDQVFFRYRISVVSGLMSCAH